MKRRDFFGVTTGALILGPLFGPTALRYHVPTRTIRKVREFPPEKILEIDEEGRVFDCLDTSIRKDIWSGHTDIGWSVRLEEGLIK